MPAFDPALMNGTLPGHMGLVVDHAEHGHVLNHFEVQRHHLAPNGFLHAASIIALADSACGYGSQISLPEGAESFTTIELKSNFLGTAREGIVRCEARMQHGGRNTQLWDAVVCDAQGKTIALFRCTQMILRPKGA